MSIEFAGAAKARELREYFSRHGRIYIVVNTTGDEVLVPDHLRGDPALRLVLNVRMPQHIKITDDCLESDFTFSGSPFHCMIPMQAIWAAYMPEQQLENGMLWEDDVPETIRAVVSAVRSMRDDEPDVSVTPSHLRAVENQQNPAQADMNEATVNQEAEGELDEIKPAGGEPASDAQAPTGTGRRVGHLRVVK
ncbi:MAG: ClpXP protease specificity-enhancing factor SspB [Mariprofundaceae bacterium]|nr:ClpXP protease specificity-enhancing factor SspB [Mariprofundaceae bacterium]